MARYGKKSQESVKKAMEKMKQGKLKSGRSGKTVESRKQAIAIGLSEARKKGAKVPSKKQSRSKSSGSKTSSKAGSSSKSRSASKSRSSSKTRTSPSKAGSSSRTRSSPARSEKKTTGRRAAASRTRSSARTPAKASRPAPPARRGNITTDHDFIRSWVEERQGKPTRVKGTGGGEDPGILRIDFPDYTGRYSLEEIPWGEFFQKFEESRLAFLYQDRTANGELSRFSKFVSRDSLE